MVAPFASAHISHELLILTVPTGDKPTASIERAKPVELIFKLPFVALFAGAVKPSHYGVYTQMTPAVTPGVCFVRLNLKVWICD